MDAALEGLGERIRVASTERGWLARFFSGAPADEAASTILAYCDHALGVGVASCEFAEASIGLACGLTLTDGRRVVVKLHQPPKGLAFLRSVFLVKTSLASNGFPCPRPLASPARFAGGFVSVEECRDEGDYRDAHDPAIRVAMATTLARLIDLAKPFAGLSGLQRSLVRSAPAGALWPEPHSDAFDFAATASRGGWIDDIARVARAVLCEEQTGIAVVGHADFAVKHFRFVGDEPAVIYDWDSLAGDLEPVIVGEAARGFTMTWHLPGVSAVPAIAEVAAFLSAYEHARGTQFSAAERRTARAAATLATAYTARCEAALDERRAPPDSYRALLTEVDSSRLLPI